MKHVPNILILATLLLGVGCGDSDTAAAPEAWVWDLPDAVPEPRVPEDNPMSAEKVELGRFCFTTRGSPPIEHRAAGAATFKRSRSPMGCREQRAPPASSIPADR